MIQGPAAGARTNVASYGSYADAQRAVDFLSDRGFPVERVAIVAEGLRLVEQVTGRLTYARAAASGALNGLFVGGFFGLLIGLFDPRATGLLLAVYGAIFGAVLGAVVGVLFYAFTGGQRDFTSIGGLQAERYVIAVDDEFAAKASALLREMAAAPA